MFFFYCTGTRITRGDDIRRQNRQHKTERENVAGVEAYTTGNHDYMTRDLNHLRGLFGISSERIVDNVFVMGVVN